MIPFPSLLAQCLAAEIRVINFFLVAPFITTSVSARGTKPVRADSLGWDQKSAKRFRFASAGGGGVFLPA